MRPYRLSDEKVALVVGSKFARSRLPVETFGMSSLLDLLDEPS